MSRFAKIICSSACAETDEKPIVDRTTASTDRSRIEFSLYVSYFAVRCEHADDFVEKGLMSIAAKRLKPGLALSVEGHQEIRVVRR